MGQLGSDGALGNRYITVSVIIDLFAVCQILLGLFIAKRHGKRASSRRLKHRTNRIAIARKKDGVSPSFLRFTDV
jgi:hypothetical protein